MKFNSTLYNMFVLCIMLLKFTLLKPIGVLFFKCYRYKCENVLGFSFYILLTVFPKQSSKGQKIAECELHNSDDNGICNTGICFNMQAPSDQSAKADTALHHSAILHHVLPSRIFWREAEKLRLVNSSFTKTRQSFCCSICFFLRMSFISSRER